MAFKSTYANEEIQEILERADTAPLVLYHDESDGVYRFFTTEERRDLWIQAHDGEISMTPEIAAYQFTDAFTAPAPYTMNINVETDNVYVREGTTGTVVKYTFSTDNNGTTFTESVDAYYTFTSSSGSTSTSAVYDAGTEVEMNVDDYLVTGKNYITILLRGRSSNASKTVVLTYNVVKLELSSSFDIADTSIAAGEDFQVEFTISGSETKTVKAFIDGGNPVATKVVTETEEVTRSILIPGSAVSTPGKHTLQLYAQMSTTGGKMFYSKLLYFDFVATGATTTAETHVMIQTELSTDSNTEPVPLTGEWPTIKAEQFVQSSLVWAYYSTETNYKTNVSIKWRLVYTNSSGEEVETVLSTQRASVVTATQGSKPDPIYFMPSEVRNDFRLQAIRTADNLIIDYDSETPSKKDDCYHVNVVANTLGIAEATEGLTMKLSAIGRSNNEPDTTKATWDYGTAITTDFDTSIPWNSNCGWNDNTLTLNSGYTAVINHKPFSEQVAPQSRYGMVFEVDFETFNVDEDDAVLLQVGNTTGSEPGPSLVITTNKAVLTSNLGTTAEARFKSDERVKLAFIIYPISSLEYPKMVFLQNNGVISQCVTYTDADTFNIGSTTATTSDYGKIKLGNGEGKAGIKIHCIRTYRTTYTMYDGFYNYVIDKGENVRSIVEKNDIYQTSSYDIDIDKLKSTITTVQIDGDVEGFMESQNPTSVALQVFNPKDSDTNMHCDNAQLKIAGQSTRIYPVISMHVKLDKDNTCYDRDNKKLPKNRWAFREGNVPEKKFRLQANYMDSSGCHNGAFMRLWNHVAARCTVNGEKVLRCPAQVYAEDSYPAAMRAAYPDKTDPRGLDWEFPYTINMVPDSIPCVVVYKQPNANKYKLLGQYVLMEEKKADFASGKRSIYNTLDADGYPDPFNFNVDSDAEGTRLWSNEDCRQFEIVTPESDLSMFLSNSNWGPDLYNASMEMIYPDPDDVAADLADGKSTKTEADYWNEFNTSFINPVIRCRDYTTAAARQAAFDNLYMSGLFNRWHWAAYYCLMMRNCCVDSVTRNMELTTYSKTADGTFTWLPKWWDNDMECGLQQTGQCNVPPCSDRNTKMSETTYYFAGKSGDRSSWLWDALEGCTQFKADVRTMDQALYDAEWNYSMMTSYQDDDYINEWSASLYNETGLVKYVNEYKGSRHLMYLQGDRTSHRHWFLRTSYEYWDAKNVCGEYKGNAIAVSLIESANDLRNLSITAGASGYFGWGHTETPVKTNVELAKGASTTFTLNIGTESSPAPLSLATPLKIYAANKLEEINFEDCAHYIAGRVELANVNDSVTGNVLKRFKFGVPLSSIEVASGATATFNTNDGWVAAVSGLNVMTRLEELSLRGMYYAVNNDGLTLTSLSSLKKFYACGTQFATFNPADGVLLTDVELPTTIRTITMNGGSITNSSGQCCIKWYNTEVDEETGLPLRVYKNNDANGVNHCPNTLKSLTFNGSMGTDDGVRKLVDDWIEQIIALDNEQVYSGLTLIVPDVNWLDFDINHLLAIAKIPKLQRELSGYIKCNTEFTTDQMNVLMEAFGTNIFQKNSPFIIDCDSKNIIISATGTNTSITEALSDANAVTYGNGKFVAVGGSGSAYESADAATTWTAVTGASGTLKSVAYGDSQFLAVGDAGSAYAYANDGEAFTHVTGAATTETLNAVAYGGGRFIAVGKTGVAYQKADSATTLTSIKQEGVTDDFNAIAYGNNRFIVVGKSGVSYAISGSTWTAITGATADFTAIAYGNGKFTALASGTNYYTLADGATEWTAHDEIVGATSAIAYGNNGFIAVGNNGLTKRLSDSNTEAWTTVTGATCPLYGVAYGGGKFMSVGYKRGSYTMADAASGWTLFTETSGNIEVMQGTGCTLTAVGFPVDSENMTFTWNIKNDGAANYPTRTNDMIFGPTGTNAYHIDTLEGDITTTENPADDLKFNIQAKSSNGGTGTINLVVKKRSYPTTVSLSLNPTPTLVDNIYQVISDGTDIVFTANHANPSTFTGTMTETSGGVWTLEGAGADETYVSKNTTESLYPQGEDLQYALHINSLPDSEKTLTMSYKSNWKSGTTLTAPTVTMCLVKARNVLTPTTNEPLFYALDEKGVAHDKANIYTSYELKFADGTINMKDLIEAAGYSVTDFTTMHSIDVEATPQTDYNIAQLLPGVEVLNLSNCSSLATDVDISGMTNYQELNLQETTVNAVLGSTPNLFTLKLGRPTQITVVSPVFMGNGDITVQNTTRITTLNLQDLKNDNDGTYMAYNLLSKLYKQGDSPLTAIQNVTMAQTAETVIGADIERFAALLPRITGTGHTSVWTGTLTAAHYYADSRTALMTAFPATDIDDNPKFLITELNHNSQYVRWADTEFLKAMATKYGFENDEHVGTTYGTIEAASFTLLHDTTYAIKGNTAIQNLSDLNLCLYLTMPTCIEATDSDFYGCTGITTITLPAALQKIGAYTFTTQGAMTTVNMSGCTALEEIEENAFVGCTGVTNLIDLSASATSLETAYLTGLPNIAGLKVFCTDADDSEFTTLVI